MKTILFAMLLAATCASAQEVSRDDAQAIRSVIIEQLDAFRRDDADRAFALATAGVRARFGSAEVFIEMVRTHYAPVYRPSSVGFESPRIFDGVVVQMVRLVDEEGRPWIALYPMERQPDGSWRVDGCQLGRLQGIQV